MIDHGLSIRDDKVYLTIPKKAGSSFGMRQKET